MVKKLQFDYFLIKITLQILRRIINLIQLAELRYILCNDKHGGNLMSNRNVAKASAPDSYYHVYTCGAGEQSICVDDSDYWFFLSLFERYLSKDAPIEVLAYCLMSNCFHLLLYQIDEDGISKLMHDIKKSYTKYFNRKYNRSGALFGGGCEISQVPPGDYLLDVSRFIHLNPDDWIDYPYSSLRAYFYDDAPKWLDKTRISKLYGSAVEYLEFLEDRQKTRDGVIV